MRDLNLNGPKKRKRSTVLSIILFIIIAFLFCLVFYEVNQIKDENKKYKNENEKYEIKVKDLEDKVTNLQAQNEELSNKIIDCSKLASKKYIAKEGVFVEFTSDSQYKEVNGTTERTGEYTFKDNIVTHYNNNETVPYYFIISQDCKNLYKINYESNEIFTYEIETKEAN